MGLLWPSTWCALLTHLRLVTALEKAVGMGAVCMEGVVVGSPPDSQGPDHHLLRWLYEESGGF